MYYLNEEGVKNIHLVLFMIYRMNISLLFDFQTHILKTFFFVQEPAKYLLSNMHLFMEEA